MRALIDANVLIDRLAGVEAERDELARLRWFLSGFTRVPINDDVSELAVAIRREHRIRLPDAIICSSENVALLKRVWVD